MIGSAAILSLTSGAAFLLGFLLVNHPLQTNTRANRWLALFTITLGLAMLEIVLASQKWGLVHPYLFETIGIMRFLTAPALYIAVCYFTAPQQSFQRNSLLHFIPFLLVLLFRIPFFITGENIELWEPGRRIVLTLLQLILPAQAIIYWFLSFRRLRLHQQNIGKFSSTHETINLFWLQAFLLILLVILLVWLNLIFFRIELLEHLTPIFYLVCVFFLAHYSLKQQEIYAFSTSERENIAAVLRKAPRSVRQKRLSSEQLTILVVKLNELLSEKIFLDNELNLNTLAKKLDVSPNDASYLINEVYHENFYNFINRHRIEEAKKLLLANDFQKLNMLGIAYQSGFNSKTAFHTAFKKFTGHSPTDYLKQNKLH